jgi:cytochrome b involved in lipid metabolism
MGSKQSKQITIIDEENRILLKLGNKWIDATEFIDQHPGGAQSILNKRNQDITIDYNFHSKSARKMIDSMIIK